jgi:hypothetical protein
VKMPPAGLTRRVEDAKAARGPIGALVGSDPGARRFVFDDGQSGFAHLRALAVCRSAPAGYQAAGQDYVDAELWPCPSATGGRRQDG